MVQTLRLKEWVPTEYPEGTLAPGTADALIGPDLGKYVSLDYPSPKTAGRWRLVPQGYVGILPVDSSTVLSIEPKVPIENVFRMLEWAYKLDAFPWPEESIHAESMSELFESLARILARRIRDRARKGLHRRYLERHERLPFVRGRMDLRQPQRLLHDPRVACHFETHTPDHSGNQILLWTLHSILRSGLLGEEGSREVGSSARALRGSISLEEFTATDCERQQYDRLSHDYEPLHALCRFFLAQSGPSQRVGNRQMTPFVLDMAKLFEVFVARWLEAHLPSSRKVIIQETGYFDSAREVGYEIDVALYERDGPPIAVLDTKYKPKLQPETSDVHQVVAYAVEKGCRDAVLVYPRRVHEPKDFFVGSVRVRTAGFPLDGAVDEGGAELLRQLGSNLNGAIEVAA